MSSERRFAGMILRRERWGLSWRGRAIVIVLMLFILCTLLLHIYPFLAPTRRVNADVLVVEGWVHEYVIRHAVEEFAKGPYERVITTGGPVEGIGHYVNDFQTCASVGADLLIKYGVPKERVQMVPSRVMDRDRTYGSALALRNWFDTQGAAAHSINVVTENVHARRTRLLFQKALGRSFRVGIIAVPNPDYDGNHWWNYSQGVKDVSSETIGYAYAKLLFHPRDLSQDQRKVVAEGDR
jgi:uncharacterized SAM-binding protein YcdF (DUF218 family)